MFRFPSRTCLLCTKISSQLIASKTKQKNIPFNLKQYKTCLLKDISVQCLGVSSYRSFSIGCALRDSDKNDNIDFSQDQEVMKWMREMQSDFSREKIVTDYLEDKEIQEKNEENEYREALKNEAMNKSNNETIQSNSASQETKNYQELQPYSKSWAQSISQRYETFDSKSSHIIYDYHEEQLRREQGLHSEIKEEVEEEIILERGETGVFDVEELVDLLKEQNAKDIAVIQVPPELKYVSYLVVVSVHSQKRISALSELIRRIHKLKKHKQDPSLLVEGKNTDWIALDMGNIALHIMKPELRETYDLETLWTVGPEYDDKCLQSEENIMDIFKISDPLAGFTASTMSSQNKSPA